MSNISYIFETVMDEVHEVSRVLGMVLFLLSVFAVSWPIVGGLTYLFLFLAQGN